MHLQLADIDSLEKRYRVNLINSLSGFKSANLIGTCDAEGHPNLAIFSSVIHMGSHPPLFGFITRPTTVPRHTYENLKETGYFTLNHVHHDMIPQAHQTSARYPREQSEFDAVGLQAEYSETLPAPYVKEARIKLGLQWEEEHAIAANGTVLVVGKLIELFLPEKWVEADGWVRLDQAVTVAISGLDAYHRPQRWVRMEYAKPDLPPRVVKQKKDT